MNRLLQAWGWAGSVEAGTTLERKIPKGSLPGGMGKADALIEGTRCTLKQAALQTICLFQEAPRNNAKYCIDRRDNPSLRGMISLST